MDQGYKKLQESIKCGDEYDIIIRTDHLDNSRVFRPLRETQLQKLYENIKDVDCSIHEIILENKPVKMFFDIDYKKNDSSNFDIDELIDLLEQYIDTTLDKWMILSAHRTNKDSYHMINSNYYFDNIIQQNNFMQGFLEYLNNISYVFVNYIDWSVYHNNKSLRMPYSCKIEDNKLKYPLIIHNTINVDKRISNGFLTIKLPDKCITSVFKDIKVYNPINKDIDIQEECVLTAEQVETILELNNIENTYISKYNNNYIELNHYGYRACLIDKEGHKSNRCFLTIKGDSIYYNCLAPKCSNNPIKLDLTNEVKDLLLNKKKQFIDNNTKTPEDIYLNSTQLEADIADYAYTVIGHKFKYFNNILYYFNSIYWIKNNNKESLHKELQTTIYNKLRTHIFQKYKDIDKQDQQNAALKGLCALKLKNKLSNIASLICDNITQYNDIFDMNKNLVGFNNGVFDLTTQSFREGRAEDYISITTGYDYIEPSNDDIKYIDKFLKQIYPVEEEREFMLKYLSTCLSGHNLRYFGIFTAVGSNGKSVLIELMESVLGNYALCGSTNVLQTDHKGGSNPEVATMNKKRLVYFNEPSSKKPLIEAQLKSLCGSDKVNARLNYCNDRTTYLHSTNIIMTNDIPQIDNVSQAIIDRLVVVPFRSMFKRKEQFADYKNEKYLFEADRYYQSSNFRDTYKLAMFYTLSRYYTQFIKDNLDLKGLPLNFKEEANKYIIECDDLFNWFLDSYEKVKEPVKTDYVQLKELYQLYKISDLYTNLSKIEKRRNTYQRFVETIQKNPQLRNDFKEEYYYYQDDKRVKVRTLLLNWNVKKIELDI